MARPGILRWMIDGCLDWQTNGLRRPDSVVEATAVYLDDQESSLSGSPKNVTPSRAILGRTQRAVNFFVAGRNSRFALERSPVRKRASLQRCSSAALSGRREPMA